MIKSYFAHEKLCPVYDEKKTYKILYHLSPNYKQQELLTRLEHLTNTMLRIVLQTFCTAIHVYTNILLTTYIKKN